MTYLKLFILQPLDSVNWEIDLNPIIIPENQWEGNEIETGDLLNTIISLHEF